MGADKLLARLDRVKQTGAGRWVACCPAHEDRSPSLSIRESGDGRILVHDHGGCATLLVLQAIGLDFGDLFDKPLAHHLPPLRGGLNARELLEINAHEATVVALLAADAQTRPLTSVELARLAQAAARLCKTEAAVHGR